MSPRKSVIILYNATCFFLLAFSILGIVACSIFSEIAQDSDQGNDVTLIVIFAISIICQLLIYLMSWRKFNKRVKRLVFIIMFLLSGLFIIFSGIILFEVSDQGYCGYMIIHSGKLSGKYILNHFKFTQACNVIKKNSGSVKDQLTGLYIEFIKDRCFRDVSCLELDTLSLINQTCMMTIFLVSIIGYIITLILLSYLIWTQQDYFPFYYDCNFMKSRQKQVIYHEKAPAASKKSYCCFPCLKNQKHQLLKEQNIGLESRNVVYFKNPSKVDEQDQGNQREELPRSSFSPFSCFKYLCLCFKKQKAQQQSQQIEVYASVNVVNFQNHSSEGEQELLDEYNRDNIFAPVSQNDEFQLMMDLPANSNSPPSSCFTVLYKCFKRQKAKNSQKAEENKPDTNNLQSTSQKGKKGEQQDSGSTETYQQKIQKPASKKNSSKLKSNQNQNNINQNQIITHYYCSCYTKEEIELDQQNYKDNHLSNKIEYFQSPSEQYQLSEK